MSWRDFRLSLQCDVLFREPPSIIVINLGGNDLTSIPLTRLMQLIRDEIAHIRTAFPQCTLVWMDILQRVCWGEGLSNNKIDRKRRRVNRWGSQQVKLRGPWHHIQLDEIDYLTQGFFRADGVHLSDVGLDMYLDRLRDNLISMLH